MSRIRIAAGSCVLVIALGAGAWGATYAFPLTTVTVRVEEAAPPAPPPNAQADEPPMPAEFKATLERLHPIRLGKGVPSPTQTTKSVRAEYPSDARAAGIQGTVQLETIIDADGKVATVRVVHSIPGLDEAAIEAAKQWEFTPPLLNGVPTPVLVTMVMNFTLK